MNTYWDHKGDHQEVYNKLYEKLVPLKKVMPTRCMANC